MASRGPGRPPLRPELLPTKPGGLAGADNGTGKFRDDVRRAIIIATAAGAKRATAAAAGGVHEDTFKGWLHKGKVEQEAGGTIESSLWVKFYEDVKAAEARSALKHLRNIEDNAIRTGNWIPSAWILERVHGYRVEQEISVKQERRVEIIIIETDDWRKVNAEAGQVIEGTFRDAPTESIGQSNGQLAIPAPRAEVCSGEPETL